MPDTVRIFFSYAHEDREYLKQIRNYLHKDMSPELEFWDDKAIPPGTSWDKEIKDNIKNADIIFLLVSNDFLRSAYINEVELDEAFARYKTEENIIVPIFVRTCPLDRPIAKKITAIQGYPTHNEKNRAFLNEAEKDIDNHLTEIYNGTLEIIEALRKRRKQVAVKLDVVDTNRKSQIEEVDQLKTNNHIFLSIPASGEGFKMRRDFFYNAKGKTEYENWNFKLFPDILATPSINDLDQVKTEWLAQETDKAIYTIHVVYSPEEFNHPLVKFQLDYARKRHQTSLMQSIVWLKTGELPPAKQQEMVIPVVGGNEIEEIFKMIAQFEEVRKKKLLDIEDEILLSSKKTIMLYDIDKDRNNDFRKKIKTALEATKKCSVRYSVSQSATNELKESMKNCDGALIVYGECEPKWFMVRQELFYDVESLKSKAIIVSNPEIEEKIKSDVTLNEFIILREDKDFIPELKKFLKNIGI